MDAHEPPRIESDGWISLAGPGEVEGVHARIAARVDGRVVITDLYVHADEITASTMRALPIGRLEAFANAVATGEPGSFDTSDTMLEQVPLIVSAGVHSQRDVAMSELRDRVPTPSKNAKRSDKRKAREQLRRPDGSDPEGFYRLVATAYNEAVIATSKPALVLAEEAGVPVTTVHRWIREARQRGYLPKARRGRAG